MSFEAIVIGGNFAGLSAAMQLTRARRRVLLVDAGAPRNRFSQASHGFLGQDGQTPAAIMREGKRQLSLYPNITIRTGKVVQAQCDGDEFVINVEGGGEEKAARLVLATGVNDTLPEISGLRERWGRSALHCPYCHGYEVSGGKLGVLANHPHSAHSAMLIPDWGATTFFTQAQFEPDEEQLVRLSARASGSSAVLSSNYWAIIPGLTPFASPMGASFHSTPSSSLRKRRWRARLPNSSAASSMTARSGRSFATATIKKPPSGASLRPAMRQAPCTMPHSLPLRACLPAFIAINRW